ncbi:hypothetical protein [Neorhizobium sp. JUb45]|uniref:hypothetical protein n=1 Tax=unclassified Neorhizobium TaxID=2629175 RepID=UPI0014055554|nr:hypothetical protein [Neorhizobium sp. JUb45]
MAIAKGDCSPEQAERDGYRSVAVSSRSPIDMASDVARAAAGAAGLTGDLFSVITHSSIHDNGVGGFWQPAAFIQRQLAAADAISLSVNHGCNGLMLAILSNASMLTLRGGNGLSVASDCFSGSGFNRWNSDAGIAYGDAAVAVCLSEESGFAKILYMDFDSVPLLEEMHRGPAVQPDNRWDVSSRKKRFLSAYGKAAFFDQMGSAVERLKTRLAAVGLAGYNAYDMVVIPFVGQSISETLYEPTFAPLGRRLLTSFGKTIGHTGPSDQILGLGRYLDSEESAPGSLVLLFGVGAGFSLSLIVIELVTKPAHGRGKVETFA